MKKIFFILLLTVFLSSPARAQIGPADIMPRIEKVTIANPTLAQAVTDAQNAAKAKDFRFMMVYGTTLYCPGIAIDARAFSIIQKNGVKGIAGTDVTFENDAAKQLNNQLVRYAEKYNTTLLSAYKTEME